MAGFQPFGLGAFEPCIAAVLFHHNGIPTVALM